jgi:tRNA(Ile)-lysidine synthase
MKGKETKPSMNPFHPFQERVFDYVRKYGLVETAEGVLVGVSGGPDSIALLHVLYSLRERLGIAQLRVLHFDHRLRGKDSDADRAFVEAQAEKLGLHCFCIAEDVLDYRQHHGLSLEMAARACRHRFFRTAMDQFRAQRLALGHTANDQAEEVLLRLLRGVGPSGAAGMLPKTSRGIIRPLLFATREQILTYLNDLGLSFREDASNLDPFCQRNALRLEVFPVLEDRFHHGIVQTLARHAELVLDEEAYWEQEIRTRRPAVLAEESPSKVALSIPRLLELHPALRRRMFRFAIERVRGNLLGIYAVHIETLCRWISRATSGKVLHLPAGFRAEKSGDTIAFYTHGPSEPMPTLEPPFEEIHGPGSYGFTDFQLDLSLQGPVPDGWSKPPSASLHRVHMDADRIKWPLLVRSWQPGDRFRPLGMGGGKKLQDFFTDAKIAGSERKRIPLLCDREKICWVVGYRLDDRVKVTSRTKRMLVVEHRELC